MTRLRKLSVSALTALSLALVPMPAAAADGEDIAKALAGLAVLGLIAKAVDDRRDRRKAAQVSRFDSNGRRILEGELTRPNRFGQRDRDDHRRFALPDRCLRLVQNNKRDRLVYGARCLRRNYDHTAELPRRCERELRTSRGSRTVYGARCLARDGWRVARQ